MKILILPILILLFVTSAFGWTLDRVRVTKATAQRISGATHKVSFTLANSGPSMMSNLSIEVREVTKIQKCGGRNWRKSGCSRTIFRKADKLFPRRGKNYNFNWSIKRGVAKHLVFRFVDKSKGKDRFEVVKVFGRDQCRSFSRANRSSFGLRRKLNHVGENIQSTIYKRGYVLQYEAFTSPKKRDFVIEYYHKGPNAKWTNMTFLAGIRTVQPNTSAQLVHTLYKSSSLTLLGNDPIFAIEYNILPGSDRGKMVIKSKKGKVLFTEVVCKL